MANPIRWRFQTVYFFYWAKLSGNTTMPTTTVGIERLQPPNQEVGIHHQIRGLYEDIDFQQGGKGPLLGMALDNIKGAFKRTLDVVFRQTANGHAVKEDPQVLHCSKSKQTDCRYIGGGSSSFEKPNGANAYVNFIITGINIQTKTIHLVWIYI